MLIERHVSWIAVNNVIGCPNKCRYCFLGKDKLTNVNPKKVASAKETVRKLLDFDGYKKDVPIVLMINTDAFSTPSNKKELFDLLDELNRCHLQNLFAIVTKREISIDDCIKLKQFIDNGNKLVVYISYSGLDETFEKGIRKNGKLESLTSIDNLYSFGIPCVHYWRPIMKQNGTEAVLSAVFSTVKDKCIASVITGLKLYPYMVSECIEFWKEAVDCYNRYPNCECVFPKNALDFIQRLSKLHNYPVFVDNVCCLSMLEKRPCKYGLFKSVRCLNYNNCSVFQRSLCKNFYNNAFPSVEKVNKGLSFVEIMNRIEESGNHIITENTEYWNSSLTNANWREI